MNVELPPFKTGEHNSKNASTINRVITPLKKKPHFEVYNWYWLVCGAPCYAANGEEIRPFSCNNEQVVHEKKLNV